MPSLPQSLLSFQEYLSFFLAILNTIAIIVSITMFFFFMLNKYSKALRYILSATGFSIFPRIRVLFLCRKSPIKKRAFIEFSMLKSLGFGINPSEWHTIINDFNAFYSINEQKLTYSIPNCTLLIGEDFSNITKKYFEYFSIPSVRKAFGIPADQISWVLKSM